MLKRLLKLGTCRAAFPTYIPAALGRTATQATESAIQTEATSTHLPN